MQDTITGIDEEERAYDDALQVVLKRLNIKIDAYMMSQQFVMMDPATQNEIMKIEMDSPNY
jgi:hypothetical protein